MVSRSFRPRKQHTTKTEQLRDARVLREVDLVRKDLVPKSKKRFRRREYELRSGEVVPWDFQHTPRSVMVVPLIEPDTLVMVCQYRPTLKRDVLEFPAGGVGVGETFKKAARKELEQETGYTARAFRRIGRYYVLPSETNRYVEIFMAISTRWTEEPQYDDEVEDRLDMSVVEVPARKVFAAALNGRKVRVVRDGKTVDMALDGLETVAALVLARERRFL